MRHVLIAAIAMLVATSLPTMNLYGQDENRPAFVVMTRTHWNFDLEPSDGMMDDWAAHEKEYLEKVTKKNEHIHTTAMLNHFYTEDNTEVILVSTYKSWADIELAQDRTAELEKEAWPDEKARNEFFRKWDSYYVNQHSDEIYRTIPGAKVPSARLDSSMVVYIQSAQLAFPEDGNMDEFNELRMEYAQKVIHANPHIKAYYPLRHAWGADNREMLHIYLVESLADVAAMNSAVGGLIQAAWPDEKARMEFMEKYNSYFTGRHGDYLYRSAPEFSK